MRVYAQVAGCQESWRTIGGKPESRRSSIIRSLNNCAPKASARAKAHERRDFDIQVRGPGSYARSRLVALTHRQVCRVPFYCAKYRTRVPLPTTTTSLFGCTRIWPATVDERVVPIPALPNVVSRLPFEFSRTTLKRSLPAVPFEWLSATPTSILPCESKPRPVGPLPTNGPSGPRRIRGDWNEVSTP